MRWARDNAALQVLEAHERHRRLLTGAVSLHNLQRSQVRAAHRRQEERIDLCRAIPRQRHVETANTAAEPIACPTRTLQVIIDNAERQMDLAVRLYDGMDSAQGDDDDDDLDLGDASAQLPVISRAIATRFSLPVDATTASDEGQCAGRDLGRTANDRIRAGMRASVGHGRGWYS